MSALRAVVMLWPRRPWGQVSGAGRGVVAPRDLPCGGAKRWGTMVGIGTGGASWGLVVGWWCSVGPVQRGVGAGVGEALWWGLDLAGRCGRGVGASGASWALWWHVGACTAGRWGAGDVRVHVWGCSCSCVGMFVFMCGDVRVWGRLSVGH
jgi:hypothetical protein